MPPKKKKNNYYEITSEPAKIKATVFATAKEQADNLKEGKLDPTKKQLTDLMYLPEIFTESGYDGTQVKINEELAVQCTQRAGTIKIDVEGISKLLKGEQEKFIENKPALSRVEGDEMRRMKSPLSLLTPDYRRLVCPVII